MNLSLRPKDGVLFGRLTMAKEVLEVEESKIAGVEKAGITFALPESLKLETFVSLEGGGSLAIEL